MQSRRKFNVKGCVVLAALMLLIALPAAAAETMTYLEYRQLLPKVDPKSFAGQPRKLWRVGKQKMRLEEPRHPETQLQGLAIVNVPDIWMINRTNRTGRHQQDPNPVRVPIFPPAEGAPWTQQLEFGHEIEFFNDQKAEVKRNDKVGGITMDRYRINRDGVDMILFVRSDKQVPLRVLMRVGEQVLGIQYGRYQPRLQPKDTLFKPPVKVKWTEVKPGS